MTWINTTEKPFNLTIIISYIGNESPQRPTKFICGFRKCQCLQQYLGSFFFEITNFNAANSEMFLVNTFVNFLFFSVGEKINKRLRRSIRFLL